MGPTECKYCGCNKFNADSVSMTRFRCGSSYWHNEEMWQVANGCAAKCAVQLVEMRERIQQADHDIEFMKAREANFVTALRSRLRTLNERIQRAVEVLDYITVEDWEERSRDAFEILRGNSPESPDSSPVTADQLAVADYYEAVRQQVPWMVTIEHIEDLVEAYRVSGLMVWKAAEHIELIFGGGNDEAE